MNAKERIKNSLAYKLGSQMLSFNQSKFKPLKALMLPFKLYLIQRRHYKELAFYKKAIKVFPQLKRRPLESLKDYDEAVFLKKHLSFLLGSALIRANKEALKGGYFKLFSYIKEAKKEFKYFKDIKDALLELRASLSLSRKTALIP